MLWTPALQGVVLHYEIQEIKSSKRKKKKYPRPPFLRKINNRILTFLWFRRNSGTLCKKEKNNGTPEEEKATIQSDFTVN